MPAARPAGPMPLSPFVDVAWDDYPRRAHLEFFRRYANPFWSVTFDLDASAVRAAAKARSASTYLGLVWAFHRALLAVPAFRYRLLGEDRLVRFSTLRAGITVPAPRATFNFSEIDWDPAFESFREAAAGRIAAAARKDALEGGSTPDFAYYTTLPGVAFTAFTHAPLPDPLAGQPEIAFGRFRETAGRSLVPVGLQVNHVFIDGAAVGELVAEAERSFAAGLDRDP